MAVRSVPTSGTGNTGGTGPIGPRGLTGADGRSAYQVWLDAGNTGTLGQYLSALKGVQGEAGQAGAAGAAGSGVAKRLALLVPSSGSENLTRTWTVPAGVFQLFIEAWGPGGAGQTGNFGGGGAGGYASGLVRVYPGQTLDYTLSYGDQGFGAAPPTTSISAPQFTVDNDHFLFQGAAGARPTSPLGARGGTGLGGTLNLQGGYGSPCTALPSGGYYVGGKGGDAPRGGCGGAGGTDEPNMIRGADYGTNPGGGGGSGWGSASTTTGGRGADGRIAIWY